MIRISFNHILPDPFIILVFAAVISLIYWIYRKKDIKLWFLLFTLNVLSVIVILSMLFKPELSIKTRVGKQENLVILVDTSLSMSITDGENKTTRLDEVKKFIKESPLLKKYNLTLYGFGDSPVKITDEKEWEKIAPIKNTSFILDAVTQVEKEVGEECNGILVFTDGQESRIMDMESFKTDFSIPVFTIGMGRSVSSDICITDVISNSPIYAGENIKIGVYLNQSGFDDRKVYLLLKDRERIIQKKTVVFSGKNQMVEFDIPSSVKGERIYEVEVGTEEHDTIPQNNRMTFSVNVISPKIKLLYVEGGLRWEYKFLKRHIESNTNFSPVFLIRVGENLFHQTGGGEINIPGDIFSDIKFLENFDIIILGDIDFSSFPSSHIKNLYECVSVKGKSFLIIGGENFAGGLKNTSAEEIIPFVVTGMEKNIISQSFLPVLTESAKTLPVFGDNPEPFPPLDRANSVTRIKPGTVPLLSAGNIRPAVVLVGINMTLPGKSAFIGTDNTWKWALGNEKEKKAYQFFWSRILRYMWTPEDYLGIGRSIPEIITDRKFYGTGEKIFPEFAYRKNTSFPSSVPDSSGRAERQGGSNNFQYSLTTPDGRTIPLEIESCRGSFTAEKEGIYTISVSAGGKANKKEVFVSRYGSEFRKTGRNEVFLKHISEFQSGGRYIRFENIRELDNILKKKKTFMTKKLSITQGSMKFFILLVFVLLNFGWYLRRRSGIL